MRYTIITPTLLRPTLKRLCDSIDSQTNADWQHIIMVDAEEPNDRLIESIMHLNRNIFWCERPHRDIGNTCRRHAWNFAEGDYLLYIDDDNYLADDHVFETLADFTEPVVLFPLLYRGEYSPVEPIEIGRSDGNQVMVRRDIGRWPDVKTRDADGRLICDLIAKHPCRIFEDRPLVVYEDEWALRTAGNERAYEV